MRKDVSRSPPSPKAIEKEPLCASSQEIALRGKKKKKEKEIALR